MACWPRHLYGLLLTFGIALIVQGLFQNYFGSSGLPYRSRMNSRRHESGFMFLRSTAAGSLSSRSWSALPPGT